MRILKNYKCLVGAFCVSAMMAASIVPALAEKIPVKWATKDGATVSGDVDRTDNYDPSMNTTFYMLLEPDLVYAIDDVPMMGDEGVDLSTLILATVAAGTAYLGVSSYAYGSKEDHTLHS